MITRLDTRTPDTTTGPPIAHAYCICHERDGISPVPSMCGQAHAPTAGNSFAWPDDKQRCAVCVEREQRPCPRCGDADAP